MLLSLRIFLMKKLYDMSSLLTNVIADTIPEPSKNFDHAEHTPELIYEEIDSEAVRRRKRPMTAKSFNDDFIAYLVDDTHKTIAKYLHLLVRMIEKKRSVVRLTQFSLMALGAS
jgi:hypothetical protein